MALEAAPALRCPCWRQALLCPGCCCCRRLFLGRKGQCQHQPHHQKPSSTPEERLPQPQRALLRRQGLGLGPWGRQQHQKQQQGRPAGTEKAGDEGSCQVGTQEGEKETLGRGPCQLWSLRDEALQGPLEALRHCKELSPKRVWCCHCQEEEPKLLTIMLHRENNALGFNIVGGQLRQGNQVESAKGIYVSRIQEHGPADKTDGIQINDKIIEEATQRPDETPNIGRRNLDTKFDSS